MDGDLVDWL